MNFKSEKKTLCTLKELAPVNAQENIPMEISLPDWCSDIKKILKCMVQPWISSVTVNADTVTASGTADIRLVYVGDKDKIDCYESQKEISIVTKISTLSQDGAVCATAKTNYVNCRATSQRRVSIEANIALSFSLYDRDNREILALCDGCTLQSQKAKLSYEQLIAVKEKTFDMGETVQLPRENGTVGKILHTSAYAVLDSQKAVSDKLLIKGQLYTRVLYCTDGSDSKILRFNHTMPISQIIDVSGIDENSRCDIYLRVRYLSVQSKNTSQNSGLLEIGAKVACEIRCTKASQCDTIEDCYSTSHEIKTQYSEGEFLRRVGTVDQQKTVKKLIDIPSGDIANIIDIWCNEATSSMTGKGDSIKADCSLNISILYLDSKGVAQYVEKNMDFIFESKIKEKCDTLKCFMQCFNRSIEGRLIASDKIEVRTENAIAAEIYKVENIRYLSSIEALQEKNNKDMAALTLYFPTKGERLWDIARRYSTTVQAIKSENGIDEDVIKSEDMMLIPAG